LPELISFPCARSRSRCPLQIARAGEADEPVSQVLPLKEDKDDKDHHNASGLQRVNERRNQVKRTASAMGTSATFVHQCTGAEFER
jgi:hypothetical protein